MAGLERLSWSSLARSFEGDDSALRAARMAQSIRAERFGEVLDVSSGATKVLVDLADEPSQRLLELLDTEPTSTSDPGPVKQIAVVYDGEDLPRVAEETGMTVQEIVSLHSQSDYVVAFCGFSPGFPYLSGTPAALHLPRLSSPRARIPAGAVAIAAGWTGIYPSPTPGGWRLIGRTDAALFDPNRDEPSLLSPGDRVRLVPC